jgi:hypothetical protein
MFLTLLGQVRPQEIPIIVGKPTEIQLLPDLITGKSSSYRIREYLEQASSAENNISLVYRDTLRSMRSLFSRLNVINSDESLQAVKCITANQERSIAKIIQEENIILPLISVSQPTTVAKPDRRKYVPLIVSESKWDDRRQRASRIISLAPKPVDISYKISVFTKYKNDLDQLSEQIYLLFNPSCELQTSFANNTKAVLVEETNESALEVADREDRVLTKSFTITVETYIPSPKFVFSSTGKIERFNTDSNVVEEMPVDSAVDASQETLYIKMPRTGENASNTVSIEKDASYRVRELILETAKESANISLVFKDTLRAVHSSLSKFKILNFSEETQLVSCFYGNPERAIAKIDQERNLIFPIISVTQPTATVNNARQKYLPLVVSESIWDDRKQRATRVVSLAPRPIDINYKVSFIAKYASDLDQLSEQLNLLFNPSHELQTSISTNTKAKLVEEASESSLTVGDREDRVLIRTYTVSVETYIPAPKFVFSSTGKIERFYSENYLVDVIPETTDNLSSSETTSIKPINYKQRNTVNEIVPSKDASYRVRELLLETVDQESNISLTYKDTLRSMRHVFSQFKLIDWESKLQSVKCIYANPERSIAKQIQEDNLILPIISISQPSTKITTDRQKYFPLVVSESIWDDRIQRARRVVSLSPKPVDISYKVTILSKYKSDLDQLTEQIQLLFNPSYELNISISDNTKATLAEETDESTLTVSDREDRILMRSFTVNVETYIPSPKFTFSSTGEIERFYYNIEIMDELS